MATIAGSVNNSGAFYVFNGSTATMAGLGNSGVADLENGSTLQINGDVTNSGFLATDSGNSGGGNTLNITGNLTSSGEVALGGPGETATIGGTVNNSGKFFVFGSNTATMSGLINSNPGVVDVEVGGTLTVNGDATNSGIIVTNNSGFGGGNTLNIIGNLTNNNEIALEGVGDVANVSTLTNNNLLYVGIGSTLNLMNQAGGITDAVSGSQFTLLGNFNDIAGGGNGFAHLNSVEGGISLYGQNLTDIPGSGTLTISTTGALEALYNPVSMTATALTINGNVDNSGFLGTGNTLIGGGNTLNITGNLTNSGTVELQGTGDMATIAGSVNNSGAFYVFNGSTATMAGLGNSGVADLENGSTLQINGDVTNSGFLATDSGNSGGGNTLNITGNLTSSGEVALGGPGETATIGGTVNNSGKFFVFGSNTATMSGLINSNPGVVDVEVGGTLTVNGDVTNSGIIVTNNSGFGGGNTLNINGNLTNNYILALEGAGDVATVSGNLNNSGLIGQYYNSSLTVGGTLTNNATGQIVLNGPGSVLQAFGGVTNNGAISVSNGSTIDPPILNNGGIISIDSSSQFVVGTGTSAGLGYIQLANGTLGEFVNMSTFGVILMGNGAPVTLDGTLTVLLQNGYNPAIGSTFEFIQFSAGELSGMFASIQNDYFNHGTEKWLVVYDNIDGFVELKVAPAPEPASLLLLGSGLLSLGYGVRRRLKR